MNIFLLLVVGVFGAATVVVIKKILDGKIGILRGLGDLLILLVGVYFFLKLAGLL